MIQTVEAVVSPEGAVRLLKPMRVAGSRRALVTILDEEPLFVALECARLSEAALAEDWNRPEEDQAWAHLQQGR
jgi:hypothetical protein